MIPLNNKAGTGPSNVLMQQCLRNIKHVPCFYRVIEARVEVWENEKCCGNTNR